MAKELRTPKFVAVLGTTLAIAAWFHAGRSSPPAEPAVESSSAAAGASSPSEPDETGKSPSLRERWLSHERWLSRAAARPRGPEMRPSLSALRKLIDSAEGRELLGPGSANVEQQLRVSPHPRDLAAAALAIAKTSAECLRDHLCGEAPSMERAYFDRDNTTTHQILAQSLQMIQEAQAQGLTDQQAIPSEEIVKNIDFQNPLIQVLSTEILLQSDDRDRAAEQLLAKRDLVVPDAKAVYYGLLSSQFPEGSSLHQASVSGLLADVQDGSPSTQLEILRGMKTLSLNAEEFGNLTTAVCAASASNPDLWRAGRGYLHGYQIHHGFADSLTPNCPS